MTREEIGRYLGLKLETVSRTLTKLQRRQLIHACGKDLRILDIDGLRTDVSPASIRGEQCRQAYELRA